MPFVAGLAAAAVVTAIAPAADPTPTPTAYTVQRGDTTYTIARRAGVSVRDIVAANALTSGGTRIMPGQHIVVPARGTAPASKAASAPTTTAQPAAPQPASAPRKARVRRPAVTAAPARHTAGEAAAVRALVARVADEQGVDQRLAMAVALQESSFRQDVVSSVGAKGVMQVMPANSQWVSQLAGRPLNLDDTRDNVTAGVVILKHLTTHAQDEDSAIGAYYQGLPSVKMRGMYAETRRYVASVKAHRAGM